MTLPLDRPNLSLQVTAIDGGLLSAGYALDRVEALRHELRSLDLVLTIAPAMPGSADGLPVTPEPRNLRGRTAVADSGSDVAAAATLGAVEVAVLPPMLPALVDFLRYWNQRNAGAAIRLALLDDAGDAEPIDPAALTDASLVDLLDRLWARRDLSDPPQAPAAPFGRVSTA